MVLAKGSMAKLRSQSGAAISSREMNNARTTKVAKSRAMSSLPMTHTTAFKRNFKASATRDFKGASQGAFRRGVFNARGKIY